MASVGDGKSNSTKFAGSKCTHCGKLGHDVSNCFQKNPPLKNAKLKSKSKGKGAADVGKESKPKCGFCNAKGHNESECRKKAAAA